MSMVGPSTAKHGLTKMTIRCLSCSHPIFVGDGVTLISPAKEPRPRMALPLFAATVYRPPGSTPDPDGRYLGCVRPNCGSGMSRLGTWVIPGQISFDEDAEWASGCFAGVGE